MNIFLSRKRQEQWKQPQNDENTGPETQKKFVFAQKRDKNTLVYLLDQSQSILLGPIDINMHSWCPVVLQVAQQVEK